MIPGFNNLASIALPYVGMQTVQYYAALGRTLDALGNWQTAYDAPVARQGNVQAIPRNKYEALGLDFQKHYIDFYTLGNMQDTGRDTSVDVVEFAGRRYNCLSATAWSDMDGWTHMMCVDIGPTVRMVTVTGTVTTVAGVDVTMQYYKDAA